MASGAKGGQAGKASTSKIGRKRWAIALAAAVLGMGTVSARAVDFFDWLGEINNPVPAPYVAPLTLNNATAAGVAAALTAREAAGQSTAVKIRNEVNLGGVGPNDLSTANFNLIFNNHNVK